MSLASAIRTRDPQELPSRKDEDWRWSDLRALIRVIPDPSPPLDDAADNPALEGFDGAVILYVNGRRIQGDRISIPSTGRGAFVRRFISASEGTAHHVDAPLEVGAGARLTLIDSFEGAASGYLASATGVIRVGEGAFVERLVLIDEPEDAVSAAQFDVDLAAGAQYAQTVLATGARRQRLETRVRQSAGARSRLDGAFLLAGARHSDQTTRLIHEGLDGVSRQLVKGVATDRSRAVFQGRIVVSPGADGSDAKMGSHAILLSDRAEVDAKPELEIYADDVQCAHGATVGSLDQDAIFYARCRGVPEPIAKTLLTAAFVGEVVERIEAEGLLDVARRFTTSALDRLL